MFANTTQILVHIIAFNMILVLSMYLLNHSTQFDFDSYLERMRVSSLLIY